jgi:hypothetical protein
MAAGTCVDCAAGLFEEIASRLLEAVAPEVTVTSVTVDPQLRRHHTVEPYLSSELHRLMGPSTTRRPPPPDGWTTDPVATESVAIRLSASYMPPEARRSHDKADIRKVAISALTVAMVQTSAKLARCAPPIPIVLNFRLRRLDETEWHAHVGYKTVYPTRA